MQRYFNGLAMPTTIDIVIVDANITIEPKGNPKYIFGKDMKLIKEKKETS